MARSKVGQWLEANEGAAIDSESSRAILGAVLEGLIEAEGISDVVAGWFEDFWALRQTVARGALQQKPESGPGYPEQQPRPNLAKQTTGQPMAAHKGGK